MAATNTTAKSAAKINWPLVNDTSVMEEKFML